MLAQHALFYIRSTHTLLTPARLLLVYYDDEMMKTPAAT